MIRIMVVEDDPYLCEELIRTFKRKGYSASGISSFDTAQQEVLEGEPDLAVLDVNLPGKSGYELCKWLKARASFPILILTARDTLSDELTALGLGADDFLTKPCHPDRLIARAERLLSTYGKVKSIIQTGPLSLDISTYKLMLPHGALILPETEGKILQLLMQRHPEILSKEEIVKAVWGAGAFVDENILQVNMTRLRKNLSGIGLDQVIRTVRGQGYVLEMEAL